MYREFDQPEMQMRNVVKRNHYERTISLLVVLVLGALLASTGFAQDYSETVVGPRGVKIIDHRPMPDPGERGLLSRAARAASHPPPAPLEDTFILHSRPGATKVSYMDFDGHNSTAWPGTDYPAWNFEGSASTFSDTERTIIQLAWRWVCDRGRWQICCVDGMNRRFLYSFYEE
jgi:hypothetical protein